MSSTSPSTSTAAPPAKTSSRGLLIVAILGLALGLLAALQWAAPMPRIVAPWLVSGVPVAASVADLERIGPDGSLHGASAFLVPSGTRIKFLGAGLDKREVEIAEGEHAGQRGWLPIDWLK